MLEILRKSFGSLWFVEFSSEFTEEIGCERLAEDTWTGA